VTSRVYKTRKQQENAVEIAEKKPGVEMTLLISETIVRLQAAVAVGIGC